MTVFARRIKCLAAHLMVGALLFAQLSHAADACLTLSDMPAMAFGNMEDGGCEGMVSVNACLQQYTASNQTTQYTQAAIVPPADFVIALLPKFDSTQPAPSREPGVYVTAAPPPRLRFCTLQL